MSDTSNVMSEVIALAIVAAAEARNFEVDFSFDGESGKHVATLRQKALSNGWGIRATFEAYHPKFILQEVCEWVGKIELPKINGPVGEAVARGDL